MNFYFATISAVLSFSSALAISISTNTSTLAADFIVISSETNSSQKSKLEIAKDWTEIKLNVLSSVAILCGGVWAFFTFVYPLIRFREEKLWIQFEIDANLYRLNPKHQGVTLTTYSWNKYGKRETHNQRCTHAVEILLKLKNKGKIRFKIYNAQVAINTILEPNQLQCDEDNGHLKLNRIFTSGNIVDLRTRFYYIEPNVEQTIHFLAVIPQPQGLLQVIGDFSLEQKRKYPCKAEEKISEKGLFPHTVARTYQVDGEGSLVKNKALINYAFFL